MRLHLTCILLIAVISMRGDALENGVVTQSSKNVSVEGYGMPPESVNSTTSERPTTAEASTSKPVPSSESPNTTSATTAASTNLTTVIPNSTTVTTEPVTSTTLATSTTTLPDSTNVTSVDPSSTTLVTTVKPNSSTSSAVTTERPDTSTPAPSKDNRHFDGLSFMGGMILTCCLVTIAAFTWKFFKVRQNRNYRTL